MSTPTTTCPPWCEQHVDAESDDLNRPAAFHRTTVASLPMVTELLDDQRLLTVEVAATDSYDRGPEREVTIELVDRDHPVLTLTAEQAAAVMAALGAAIETAESTPAL
ncbi:hypothetical protein AB0C65_35905 [Nocardia sp. NPDC048505]|uniref:DUF6907 domain-containing protein n=1 Tax=Nocardia sp. NPDC048505 TaxID=3155756 RepID=UPI0033F5A3D0